MIEKSSFRHKERPDTGRGDKRAFSMPFQQLRLGLHHIRSSKRWDQLIRCTGTQCWNDHPVRLQICRYRLHGYCQSPCGPDFLPPAYDRDIEIRCSAHLPGGEFICERERVEHDSEPGVEHSLKGEDGNAHGVNDSKIGI